MRNVLILVFLCCFHLITSAECNPASSESITQLETNISKQSFEEGKLNTLKEFLKTNCISAKQLSEILSHFSFEEDKIEAIKAAISKISDPESIKLVLEKLEFESSRKEVKKLLDN